MKARCPHGAAWYRVGDCPWCGDAPWRVGAFDPPGDAAACLFVEVLDGVRRMVDSGVRALRDGIFTDGTGW